MSWPMTLVCGASGTGRSRFAHALATSFNGHVIDTGDVLEAVRAMTGPEQHPELFYQDAEDLRGFVEAEGPGRRSKQPLTGTAEELAAARLRAADVLAAAVHAVMVKQPRLRLDVFLGPHTVVTGRHALRHAGLGLRREPHGDRGADPRQPRDPLSRRLRRPAGTDLDGGPGRLLRRGNEHARSSHCEVISAAARPWSDAVDRVRTRRTDLRDSRNALG